MPNLILVCGPSCCTDYGRAYCDNAEISDYDGRALEGTCTNPVEVHVGLLDLCSLCASDLTADEIEEQVRKVGR